MAVSRRQPRRDPNPGTRMPSAAHQRLDLARLHRHVARDQLAAVLGHDRVVLDADADVVERLGHAGSGADVEARFDGEDHAGAQDAAGAVGDGFARQRVLALAGVAHLRRLHVAAAVVNIHPEPMAGAVHVEREIRALLDHVLRGAVLALVEQAQVQQALRQHGHGGFVRVVEARARLRGGHGRMLAREHEVVHVALRPREAAVGREGARDVAGIAVQLAAGVDQHQFARAHGRSIGAVVQHAGIGTGSDDGVVRHRLRAVAAELVQQFGVEVVFAHVLAGAQHARAALHGTDVGACADAGGPAHHVLLVRVLHQPHLVEQGAEVSLLRRTERAEAHAGAHLLQPAVHPRRQTLVRGEGEPHPLPVFEQPRQQQLQLRRRVRGVHAQRLHGRVGPQPVAVPDLALQVLGLAKERGTPFRGKHQPGLGFGESGEVVEVAVVPVEVIGVPVAQMLGRRGDDGDAALAQQGGEVGATAGMEGGKGGHRSVCLVLECGSGCRRGRTSPGLRTEPGSTTDRAAPPRRGHV